MEFYFLFTLNLALLFFRFLRSKRWGERTLFLALFLFFILTLAMHPWIRSSSHWLPLLENAALGTSLIWLASGPVFAWLEKRRQRKLGFFLLRNGKGHLHEIVLACRMLSEAGEGALIAIERKDSLASWIESGVPLDAKIRRETIFSIFTPPGALHDGGLIIQGERMAAAGVVFPLSKRLDLPTELGTRHRAALGMSEGTDALAIVVSEETGKISLAVGAKLLYDVKSDKLPEFLEAALKNRTLKRQPKTRLPKTHSTEPALR